MNPDMSPKLYQVLQEFGSMGKCVKYWSNKAMSLTKRRLGKVVQEHGGEGAIPIPWSFVMFYVNQPLQAALSIQRQIKGLLITGNAKQKFIFPHLSIKIIVFNQT